MTAEHIVCVAGLSVSTVITMFSDSSCILDMQKAIYTHLFGLHFLYRSSIFYERLDTPSQATMLLLGDKQGTVMEYNSYILMALGGVVHYLVVFV